MVLTTAALLNWRVYKADVKSAFLQTGKAQRDVYVLPPKESADKRHSWLLLTAAYGLVNANAKWQSQSDEELLRNGLQQFSCVPQLFYLTDRDSGKTTLLLAKIVDDFLLTGVHQVVTSFLRKFDAKFKFGTVCALSLIHI